ncbi:MAG TPA: hypothetical protein PKA54_01895 [Chitinophagaceae bacterium]|nr:MAG: hypothetical protein UZ11_BCD004001226 [Bacteroidetes bacterium OLB11]HMN32105.1 hypothetical protein [Chitinophagaceae bacterium]
MKNILVIYYSQTGQLKQIIESVLSEIKESVVIDYREIIPQNPFPFPWTSDVFFDAMPESVQQISEPIEPLDIPNKNYDLVILGYQPWFLSPSIPINSFLQSEQAQCLKNKNILTIIGARNMWLNAQEKIKYSLINLNAKLVGNIVLCDNNPNLISVLTVMRWTFKGQKEKSTFLPDAGVQSIDITNASRFGNPILKSIESNQFQNLQTNLLKLNAVDLKPDLVILEKRGIKNFRKFSNFILKKGERGNPQRLPRVKLFKRLLIIGVFILSPISNLTARFQAILNNKTIFQKVEYFKNISYHENEI